MFQLLVWSVRSLRGLFCTYEKTAVATEYFEIVGLEEVEVFLPLTRLPISEYTLGFSSTPFSFGLENLPIIIVKGLVLQIEKYLKRRSAANVCSTRPIRSNVAYSISWSKRKWK